MYSDLRLVGNELVMSQGFRANIPQASARLVSTQFNDQLTERSSLSSEAPDVELEAGQQAQYQVKPGVFHPTEVTSEYGSVLDEGPVGSTHAWTIRFKLPQVPITVRDEVYLKIESTWIGNMLQYYLAPEQEAEYEVELPNGLIAGLWANHYTDGSGLVRRYVMGAVASFVYKAAPTLVLKMKVSTSRKLVSTPQNITVSFSVTLRKVTASSYVQDRPNRVVSEDQDHTAMEPLENITETAVSGYFQLITLGELK